MTDDLRERVLAMADAAQANGTAHDRLALAVAAMVAEECAQACEDAARTEAMQ